MWDIAEQMLHGDICNKCWVFINLSDETKQDLPINCNSCHNAGLFRWDCWIYSEAFYQKMEADKDPIMSWILYISYNAYMKWIKLNYIQLKFFSEFLYQTLLAEEDSEDNISL